MRKMKDSGIEWIGEIPDGWGVEKVKRNIRFINGYGFDSNELNFEGAYPVIKIGDISNGKVDFENANRSNSNVQELEGYKVKKKDILLAMSGATVGKTGYIDEEPPTAFINQRVGIIRLNHPKFLYYILNTDMFLQYVTLLSEGSAQPNISTQSINEFKIPKPSPSEQKTIADFLDSKCSQIDSALELTKDGIQVLEEYKKSLITETVTHGLRAGVPMKDSGIEWIGEIPEGWEVTTISRIFDIKAGGDLVETQFSDIPTEEHKYPIYTNKQNRTDVYGYSTIANYPKNSITVTGRGDVGIAYYRDQKYDAIIRLLVLIPKEDRLCKYYEYFINGVLVFEDSGSAIPQLSAKQLSPHKVCVPSPEEQKEIADFLDSRCKAIDNIIARKQEEIKALEAYKKSLIYEYVTGKRQVE